MKIFTKTPLKALFCIDGTDVNYYAIKQILPTLKKNDIEAHLLYVIDTGFHLLLHGSENISKKSEITAHNVLNRMYELLTSEGFKVESKVHLTGNPHETILNEIKNKDYDLTIIAASGKTGLKNWLGSVSRKVLYKSKIPVLVTKLSPLKPDLTVKTRHSIVAAADGTTCAYNALKNINHFFNLKNTDVDLITVKLGIEALPVEITMDNEWLERALAKQKEIAEEILTTSEQILNKHHVKVRQKYSPEGDPSDEILKFLDNNEYDLIVMGSHGREGISDILLGSVSKKVLEHSHTPVLIVPTKQQ